MFLSQLKIQKCPGIKIPPHYHLDNSQFSLRIILLNEQFCKEKKDQVLSKAHCWTAFVPFSFMQAKHTLFFPKASSWALIALASMNSTKPADTSPALTGHSTASHSPAKNHPAQHRIISDSTEAHQNTFGRKINISLLWFQGTCLIERILTTSF